MSGEIAPKTRAEVVKSARENFIAKLELEASLSSQEGLGNAIGDDIMEQILSAGSDEELEATIKKVAAGLPSAKDDMVDVEQSIVEFTVMKGSPAFEEHSIGYFYIVDCVILETGQQFRYTVGARQILATLWVKRQNMNLPYNCVIRSKPSAEGAVLYIKGLPKRVIVESETVSS